DDTREEQFRVGLNAGADRIVTDMGALVQITAAVRAGFAFRQGASWTVTRSTSGSQLAANLNNAPTTLRAPSVFEGGLALRLSPRILLSGQVDYVLYHQLQENLDIR